MVTVSARRRALVAAGGALLLTLGALGAAAWTSGTWLLASGRAQYIPMAPSTAAAFALLGAALVLSGVARRLPRARIVGAAAGVLAAAMAAQKLLQFALALAIGPDLDAAVAPAAGTFGQVPLGRMSPVTAAGLAAAGFAVMALYIDERRQWRDRAGWAAAAVAALGGTVLLGYAC